MNQTASPWPDELRLNAAKDALTIRFTNAEQHTLAAEYLRVESPSAEVQGHGPGQRQTVSGKKHVKIAKIEPVGHYAVRLIFDDGHDTGIYSWRYLAELAHERDTKWPAYLEELAIQRLKRE
jgi:DUF971 family protein